MSSRSLSAVKGVADSHSVVQKRIGNTLTDVGKTSKLVTKQLRGFLQGSYQRGEALLIEDAVRSVLTGVEMPYRLVCDLQYLGHWGMTALDVQEISQQRNIPVDESQRIVNFCLRNKILFEKTGSFYTQEAVSSHLYEFSANLRGMIRSALLRGTIPNLDSAKPMESDVRDEVNALESQYLVYKYDYVSPQEKGSLPTTYFVPNSLALYQVTLEMAQKVPISNRLSSAQDYVASLHRRQALQTILGLPIFYEPSRLAIPTTILNDMIEIMDKCSTLQLSKKEQVRIPVLNESIPASVPSYAGIFTASLLGLTPSTLIGHEDYTLKIVEHSPQDLVGKFNFGRWVKSFKQYYDEYWLRYLLGQQFDWIDARTRDDLVNNLNGVVAVCTGQESASRLAKNTSIPVSLISLVKRKAISNGLAGRIHFRSHPEYFFEG